ncbi:unnamed protein product [Prunus armeniaca]
MAEHSLESRKVLKVDEEEEAGDANREAEEEKFNSKKEGQKSQLLGRGRSIFLNMHCQSAMGFQRECC